MNSEATKKSKPSWYRRRVPRGPTKKREPDDSVPVQVYMPHSLKERAQDCAKREGEQLSVWLRSIIRAAVEQREGARERKGK
jgi:hypothetical protein